MQLLLFLIQREEVLLEEVKANSQEVLEVQLSTLHLLSEELTHLIEVKDGGKGGGLLAGGLAPGQELFLVRIYWGLGHQQLIYNSKFLLRGLEF